MPAIIAGRNFTLISEYGPLNVLAEISGVGGYLRVWVQSELQEVFRLSFLALSLDGLIAAKTASGRSKDKLHLLELEELKKLLGRDGTRAGVANL